MPADPPDRSQEPEGDESGLLLLDAIYDALENGEPELALRLARREQERRGEQDPVLDYLAGVALIELDRPAEAEAPLARATRLDPADADFRAALARALFRCCRFAEAAKHNAEALRTDAEQPDAHYLQGLLAERRGEDEAARGHFQRASELDPERYPTWRQVPRTAFEQEVARAIDRLPEPFRQHLEQVAVTVEPVPADAVLSEDDPPLDPENLLGLFVGLPLGRDGFDAPPSLPPRILLFQRNLERLALDEDELVAEIAVTLYHELGHYLGLDEDELEAIDLG